MRQFGFDQTENDENDCDARDEIMVGVVLVEPQFSGQPGKFDRPRKEADKNRYEIKGQQQEIHPERIRAVAFHRDQRTADDVASNSDRKKLAMRLDQRWNSPNGDDCESKQNAARNFESPREMRFANEKHCRSDR